MADVELDVTFETLNNQVSANFGTVYVIDNGVAVKIIADKYSNTNTYEVGDYVIYNDLLYKCITVVEEPEEFDPEKWLPIKLANDVKGKADTAYVDTELAKKANTSTTYTKAQSDNKFATISTTYTKTQSDSRYPAKTDVYTKTQAEGRFPLKNDVYTKIQSDGRFALITNTYTKAQVDAKIAALPEAMVFKGTLGVNGDIQALPTASAENEGYTYKCITAGTYSGLNLKVGDTVTCFNPPNTSVYEWDISGYGDTDTDTWRSIKINGEEALGSGISSGSVDFVGSENIDVEFDSDGNKIGIKTKNIYTQSEVGTLIANAVDSVLPTDSVSKSAVANFETDYAKPIELKAYIEATQNLHGQSGPYPAGGGINKWDEQWELGAWSSTNGGAINYTDRIRCKNAIPVLPSTSYCIRFGITASSVVNAYDTNGDFIENLTTGTFGTGGRVVTTPANCYFIKFSVGTAYGTTYNNDISLNYPSTDTDYHPYSNICPVGGWSEMKIARIGDNTALAPFLRGLLQGKYTFVEMNSLTWTYSTYSDVNYFVTSVSLPNVKAPTATGQTANAISNRYTNVVSNGVTSPVFVSGTMFIWTTGRLFVRDTAYSDATLFKNSLQGTYLIYELAEPVTPTITTEQFNTICQAFGISGEYITIALGDTYYGGYVAIDKAGHRQLVVTDGIEDMGDLTYTYSVWGAGSVFSVNLPLAKEQATSSQKGNIVSTFYKNISSSDMYNNNPKYSMCLNRQIVRIANPDYSDKDTFKTAMGSQKLIYELATPIIVDLPDGEPINALIGTNNLFADSGDSECAYKESVELYVNKRIASVQALTLNT